MEPSPKRIGVVKICMESGDGNGII